MAVWTFSLHAVYAPASGSLVRTVYQQSGTVTRTDGTATPPVTQGGTVVSQVTTDGNGGAKFTVDRTAWGTSAPEVLVTFGTLSTRLLADEYGEYLQSVANGPTATAIDTHMGGPAANLLDADGNVQPDRAPSVFVATGGDDTAALNTFLAAATPLGVKKLIGAFTISGTVTHSLADTVLDLSAATITTTSATVTAVAVSGDRASVVGGRIISPASWDGSNTGTAWTFAVVLVTGADCTVRDVRLSNVPRVGIGAKDANGTTRVLDCTVEGNYPAASWTEVETMHFGVGYDPGATSSKLIAMGNTIKSCVQGVFLGNYGTGSSTGSIVQGNTFEGCHNHAVYGSAGVTYLTATGNTVVDCSRPFAVTGEGHNISHNNMYATGTSGNLAEVCSINVRDAVNAVVAFNTMRGLVHASTPAIDLSRTGTNVTLKGNRVVGNRIEVTGSNTAIGIRIGSGAETDMHSNIVAQNEVRSPGQANQGVISFFGANGSQAYGCKCVDNVIVITGSSNGIHVSEMRGLDVWGNHVRVEFDSATAVTIGGVFVTANSTGTKVRNNDFECTSTYGGNVTVRSIWENTNVGAANRYGPNRYSIDTTKAVAVTHIIQGTSGSILTEVGMTGAPTTVCGPGSTWTRADGAASTTLYVKESAASSGTWRAV